MADIAGFRGLLYDKSKVDISKVLAPPYDVIDDAGREELEALDVHNCVRIILPTPSDAADPDSKYSSAKELMKAWQDAGVLVHDDKPAIYRYHQIYKRPELGPDPVTRRGFIAAVRLHDFDERVIRRHERTLKGPKVDRLKLWDTTRCHLSQIFTLYSDPEQAVDALFEAAEAEVPTVEGTTADGTRHVLWRVQDPQVIEAVSAALAPKNLYIADGHHRYETMLALRNRLLEGGELDERSAARYGMMFLANMEDPGLVVLPTHRLVHSLAALDLDSLRAELARYFELRDIEGGAKDAELLRAELASAAEKAPSFACIVPGSEVASILTLRADVDLRAEGLEGSDETLALDVTLLHGLVLEKILGIDRAAQEAQSNIHYVKDTQAALDICSGKSETPHPTQLCFLMNATPVSQVVAVSDADDVMPQKSTFFYPKIASGVVLNPIDTDERL